MREPRVQQEGHGRRREVIVEPRRPKPEPSRAPVPLDDLGPLNTWDETLCAKTRVDREIADLKSEVGQMKSRAFATGQYADPRHFRAAEAKLRVRQQQSQELQARLGRMREEMRRENVRETRNQDRCFREVARKRLPPDIFQEIADAANDMWLEGEESER